MWLKALLKPYYAMNFALHWENADKMSFALYTSWMENDMPLLCMPHPLHCLVVLTNYGFPVLREEWGNVLTTSFLLVLWAP